MEHGCSSSCTQKHSAKSLAIYHRRDHLLKAIHDNQVLIITAQPASGKTTQIPQYLHQAGYTERGKVVCTQPQRLAAMSAAARVSLQMGVKLGHEVGFSIRFQDCSSHETLLKYITDGALLRDFLRDPKLNAYSVVMIDDAHERSVSSDVLLGLLKDLTRLRPDLKLLVSTATLGAQKFSDFFDGAPIFEIFRRCYPVEVFNMEASEDDYLEAAITATLKIHETHPPGDMLVFLPGQEEIETAQEIITHRARDIETKISELIVCPMYANIPSELQAKIFEPIPEGARRVVLATDIAETLLTIDGIMYVIDPGFCKIKSYNPRNGIESLQVSPVSKELAIQRMDYAGRTGPGKCFRLYTTYTELEDNTVPEIQRTNLSSVVLMLMSIGVDNVADFDFMDPPLPEALTESLEVLYALGAINGEGKLTKLGRKMAEFPLNPMLSKAIVSSNEYKCSEEIISIASMLSVGNSIFYRRKDKQVHADNARKRFHAGDVGDHVALLRVYNSWKESGFSTHWCNENYVQVQTMKRARDIREQLKRILQRVEIELVSNETNLEAIYKAITSGFFPHCARHEEKGLYRTVKHSQGVYVHPSSGVMDEEAGRWVIYNEIEHRGKEYMMKHVTQVKAEWLVEIAPNYLKHVQHSDN